MEDFSKKYLASGFCSKAMDTLYSRYQMDDPEEILDHLQKEFQLKEADGKYLDPDAAFWIGWTYRQMYFRTGKKSAELNQLVSFEQMAMWYPGLHTIDEEMAADLIEEYMNRQK